MTNFQNSCYSSICPPGSVNLDQLQFEFQQTNYKDFSKEYHHRNEGKNYLKRKIQSIPCALLALTKAICHVAQLAFYSIKALISKHDKPLKAYGFYVLRDIQEALGRLISLFHDCSGLYLLEKSRFHKEYYHALLTKDSFVHAKISSARERNEIRQRDSKDEIEEPKEEIHEDGAQPHPVKEKQVDSEWGVDSQWGSDDHETLDNLEKPVISTSNPSSEDIDFFKELDSHINYQEFVEAYKKYKEHYPEQVSISKIEFAKKMIESCISRQSYFVALLYVANLFNLKSEEAVKAGKEIIDQIVSECIKIKTYEEITDFFVKNPGYSGLKHIKGGFAEAYFKENSDNAIKLISDEHYGYLEYAAYHNDSKGKEDFYPFIVNKLLEKDDLFLKALEFVQPYYQYASRKGEKLIDIIISKWINTKSYDEVAQGFRGFLETFTDSQKKFISECRDSLEEAYLKNNDFDTAIKCINEFFPSDEKKDAIIEIIEKLYRENRCAEAEEYCNIYLSSENDGAEKQELLRLLIEENIHYHGLPIAYNIIKNSSFKNKKEYFNSVIEKYIENNKFVESIPVIDDLHEIAKNDDIYKNKLNEYYKKVYDLYITDGQLEKAVPTIFKMTVQDERTEYLIKFLNTANNHNDIEPMKKLIVEIVYHSLLLESTKKTQNADGMKLRIEAERFIKSDSSTIEKYLKNKEFVLLELHIREHIPYKINILYPTTTLR